MKDLRQISVILFVCICMLSHSVKGANYTFSNVTLNSPMTLSGWVNVLSAGTANLLPGDRVTFTGTCHLKEKLTIDVMTFLFFENCIVKCEPEVEIIIDPTFVNGKIQTISLIESHIYCTSSSQMWQGFTSNMNEPAVPLSLFINIDLSVIEDAKVAFSLKTNNWFNVKNSIFNRNAIGISLLSEVQSVGTTPSYMSNTGTSSNTPVPSSLGSGFDPLNGQYYAQNYVTGTIFTSVEDVTSYKTFWQSTASFPDAQTMVGLKELDIAKQPLFGIYTHGADVNFGVPSYNGVPPYKDKNKNLFEYHSGGYGLESSRLLINSSKFRMIQNYNYAYPKQIQNPNTPSNPRQFGNYVGAVVKRPSRPEDAQINFIIQATIDNTIGSGNPKNEFEDCHNGFNIEMDDALCQKNWEYHITDNVFRSNFRSVKTLGLVGVTNNNLRFDFTRNILNDCEFGLFAEESRRRVYLTADFNIILASPPIDEYWFPGQMIATKVFPTAFFVSSTLSSDNTVNYYFNSSKVADYAYGFRLKGGEYNSVIYNNVVEFNPQSYYTTPPAAGLYYHRIAGISTERRYGNGFTWISENRIYGSAGDIPPNSTVLHTSPIGSGERVNGINSILCNDVYAECNRMCKLHEGFKYLGKHTLTRMVMNKLYDKHHTGLGLYKYFSNGEIGNQGIPGGNDHANQFNGIYTNAFPNIDPPGPGKKAITFASDGNSSPFHNHISNSLLNQFECGALGTGGVVPINIQFNASSHYDNCVNRGPDVFNCNVHNISDDIPVIGIEDVIPQPDLIEQQNACLHIVNGENLNSYDADQTEMWGWYDKLYVYRKLLTNNDLLNNHADLITFYKNESNTSIGLMAQFLNNLEEIGSVRCEETDYITSLLVQLANVPDDLPIVTLEKSIHQAQLEVWTQPGYGYFNFDSNTLATIQAIANMCPAEGGFATFKARRLIIQYNPSVVWNDDDICSLSSFRNRKVVDYAVNKVNLYPNPSQGVINLCFEVPLKQKSQWNVVGTDGHIVHTFWLEKESVNEVLNVDHLATGIYYLVNVFGEYKTQKILISK